MRNLKGIKGEEIAKRFLEKNGYVILEQNYVNKIGEIDIVAKHKKTKTIVFVEVKFRTDLKYGYPREAVNLKKQQKIKLVAQTFITEYKLFESCVRFDVIDILNNEITHIENAF